MIARPHPSDDVVLRHATLADVPALAALIAESARALSTRDYSSDQIEAALLGAWGVDTQLITDQSYFIGIAGEAAVVCGGWSHRATTFGSDTYTQRESRQLDPATEPARIRAFFVHPTWARRGLATRLLARCEADAKAAGFTATELVATLPGERFYAHHGYVRYARRSYALPGGMNIDFIPMRRSLG